MDVDDEVEKVEKDVLDVMTCAKTRQRADAASASGISCSVVWCLCSRCGDTKSVRRKRRGAYR